MAHLHVVIGPVGAGKSTFAARLCREHRALSLNLDDWMARLYGDDPRPATGVIEWYLERRDRCIAQIWELVDHLVEIDVPAVLEIGLIQRCDRLAFYDRADLAGCGHTLYVLDAPREVRRARVEQRNRDRGATFSMHVPPEIFELASDMWEPPDEAECRDRDVRFVDRVP